MDVSQLIKRFTDGFRGGADTVAFLVIVGGALVFVVYLAVDSLYHRRKWRRLNQKFRETLEHDKTGKS